MGKHRAHHPKCQKQWRQEKPKQKTCKREKCGKTFRRKQQLQHHRAPHKTSQKKPDHCNLDPSGEIDRRQIIYKGEQNTGQTHVYQIIQYNIKEKIWGCKKCSNTSKSQDKNNLIQHALKNT